MVEADSLTVQLRVDLNQARECVEKLRGLPDAEITMQADPDADTAFKFAEILPALMRTKLVNARMIDVTRVRETLHLTLTATFRQS